MKTCVSHNALPRSPGKPHRSPYWYAGDGLSLIKIFQFITAVVQSKVQIIAKKEFPPTPPIKSIIFIFPNCQLCNAGPRRWANALLLHMRWARSDYRTPTQRTALLMHDGITPACGPSHYPPLQLHVRRLNIKDRLRNQEGGREREREQEREMEREAAIERQR